MIRLDNHKTLSTTSELSEALISQAIFLHQTHLLPIYKENEAMYMSDHDILHEPKKAAYKPDNRLVVNYARYIVDSFGGYHLGIPMKVTHKDEKVAEFLAQFRQFNDMEDTEYEVAKDMDIFGHSYFYVYQNEDSKTCVAFESPKNMFIIYDQSIKKQPLYAVRYEQEDDAGVGEVVTAEGRHYFKIESGNVHFTEEEPHIYRGLPVIELILNEERQGLFDGVKTLINALNKAASEKANDVDYFSDAYLKIAGVRLDEDAADAIRDSRIINLYGNADKLDAEFLQKPNADETQENLIEFLKESIFSISMVANMTESDFGQSSGTALAFKLLSMSNLARMKDRKMQSAFNRLYEVVFSVAGSGVQPEDWTGLIYTFTRNIPKNDKEEAEIVSMLDGKLSQETLLSYLSKIQDVGAEIDRIEKEAEDSLMHYQLQAEQERLTDDHLFGDEADE